MSPESPCPHAATISRIETDMYFGDTRKPGVTIRIERLEDGMERSEDTQKSTDRKFWAIIILLISTLTGIIVDIATKHHP